MDRSLHIALHKPCGYVCTHNPLESPIIYDLIPRALLDRGLQAVGRLDRDTSGLLILTTDGRLIHHLAQPGSKVEKQYRIGFRGVLSAASVERFAEGVHVDGYATRTLPADLVVERPTRFQSAVDTESLGEATIVLREGRNHQVKRMFKAVGVTVVTLHRERFGDYTLPKTLSPGEFVEIELAQLGVLPTDL